MTTDVDEDQRLFLGDEKAEQDIFFMDKNRFFLYSPIFVLLVNFVTSQEILKCPKGKYGVNCKRNCFCEWNGARYCHVRTGQCICKKGFKGTLCEDDIDECHTNAELACPGKFTACENSPGSHKCHCQSGYKKRISTGLCTYCTEGYGLECRKECKCLQENTLVCQLSTGECICKSGWEGPRCATSIDDCVGNLCSGMLCVDRHKGYACICEENKRYIQGKCRLSVMDFVSHQLKPSRGERVSLYLLFSLYAAYLYKPNAQPNFIYKIQYENKDLCSLDFHHHAKRVVGNEDFIKKLQTTVEYNFYIELSILVPESKKFTIRALPDAPDYTEKLLLFDSSITDTTMISCLKDARIADQSKSSTSLPEFYQTFMHHFTFTRENLVGEGEVYVVVCSTTSNVYWALNDYLALLGAENYTSFEFILPTTKECGEIKLEWSYYLLPDTQTKSAGSCVIDHSVKPLNMQELLSKADQQAITNQDERIDIIPKNTLPIGLLSLCVKAYAHNDKNLNVFECTFFRVLPGLRMTVSWVLPAVFITWNKDELQQLFLGGDFELISRENNGQTIDAHIEVNKGSKCQIRSKKQLENSVLRLRAQIQKGQRVENCKLHYNVTVRGHPLRHEFTQEIQFPQTLSILASYVECLQSCSQTIGLSSNCVYQLITAFSSVEFHWTVQVNGTALKDEYIKNILYGGQYTDRLSTKADSLQPSSMYHFICMYKVKRAQTKSGQITLLIKTENRPQGKGCEIEPKSGQPAITKFTLTCDGYIDPGDEPKALSYKIYQLVYMPNGEAVYTVIAFASQPKLKRITLSAVHKEGQIQTETQLKVEIQSVVKSSSYYDLSVSFEPWDQKTILDKMLYKVQNLLTLNQEDLRVAIDVASVLQFSSTAPDELKREMRSKLLSSLTNYPVKNTDTIEMVSYSLLLLSKVENEIEETALNHAVHILEEMAKNLSAYSIINIETAERIAKIQMQAANSLLSISFRVGKLYSEKTPLTKFRELKLKESLDRGQKLVSTVSSIVHVLMKSLFLKQEPIKFEANHLDIFLETQNMNVYTVFDLHSNDGQAQFSVPAKLLGDDVLKISTDFELFRKNPYIGISDDLQGDLPLLQIQFHENEYNFDYTKRQFSFSEPADIFIEFNKNIVNGTEYELLIQLSQAGGKLQVIRSACVFISIPVSKTEATVLSIESVQNLQLLIKARYTNAIGEFENLYDDEMLTVPLRTVQAINTSLGRTFVRDENLIFLPMLQPFQVQKNIKFYRVMIRVKLYQKVDAESFQISTITTLFNASVIITPYKMSCLHFDRDAHKFLSDKCMLTMFSNLHQLHCQCVVAAAFTGSFFVMPRLINPINVGLFLGIFDNPLVVTMVIALWMIAFAAFLYGRRKDKEDEIKREITVLDDNREDYTYVYLVCIITGWFARAYTTSNVFIIIKGSWNKSETHLLADPKRKLFQSGAENWFILTTKGDLGQIKSVHVWTDFSGSHPSWYLNCIYVQNMLTRESWLCTYNSWLNCEFTNTQLKAEIPAVKEKEYLEEKFFQFLGRSQYGICNDHLWFGMVAKSSYNGFTRVKRIVTGLTMLQTLMILNLMFFGIEDFDDSRQFLDWFGYKIHMTSIFIGVESALFITFVGLSVTFFFNRVAPRPDTPEEMTEDERELIQACLARNDFTTTHPVDVKANQESEILDISDNVNQSSEQGEKWSFPWCLFDWRNERQTYMKYSLNTSQNKNYELQAKEYGYSRPDIDFNEDKRKHQNCFQLPWWFIYIHWTILGMFNLFLAYYIMLYGLSLGYEKSVDWSLAFFTGFLTDILIFQPVKVVLIAFIVILILKQRYTLKDQAPITRHTEGLELLYHNQTRKKNEGTRYTKTIYQMPLYSSNFAAVLERLKIESMAREMLRDFFLYTMYMSCILLMIYGHVDVFTRYHQIRFAKHFYIGITEPLDVNNYEENLLADIHDATDMWNYLKDVIIPGLISDENSNKLQESIFVFGAARLRQARVKPDSEACSGLPETIRNIYETHFCIHSMDEGQEDNNSYVNSWKKLYEGYSKDLEDSPFVYKTAKQLGTASFLGHRGTYPGGGYVANLSRDSLKEARKTLETLIETKWLDLHTRCIFLEFSLYNPGTDLLMSVFLAFEFDGTSGIFPYYSISAGHFYMDNSRKEVWLQISEGITGISIVFYTVIEIQIMIEQGTMNYMRRFWNWLEIAVLILTFIVGLLYLLCWIAYMEAINTFRLYGHSHYIDLGLVFYRHYMFSTCMGILGALTIFKMLKIITFNPFTVTYTKTLQTISSDFAAFSFVAAIFLFSFSTCATLIFGHHIFGYMSIDRALYNLMFFILKKTDFENLVATNRVLGPIFFLIVMVVTQYLIVNFFIAVLREGLELAKHMSFQIENAALKHMLRQLFPFLKRSETTRT